MRPKYESPSYSENDKHLITEYIDHRAEFWKEIAIAVASSGNARDKVSMVAWADFALEAYDNRFGQIKD